MKVVIVALALVALAAAASLRFESENGTSRQEEGTIREVPDKDDADLIFFEGRYSARGKSQILRYAYDQVPGEGYKYGFESDDGTSRQEEGIIREVPDEENNLHPVIVVRGSYAYINNEGKQETFTYEADQKGFRAFGDSISKPVSRR